jgi:ferritin-like metal-binding protein YciE
MKYAIDIYNLTNRRMKNESNAVDSSSQLNDFFIDQLNEILHSERKIIRAWPALQDAVCAGVLRQLFQDYYLQVEKEITRLDGIFALLGIAADGRNAQAIEGLLTETNDIIGKTTEGSHTRDAAIIIAVQKIAHYKIATYGSLQQLATTLGMEEISTLLSQSLQEEKENDFRLSEIADKQINWLAEIEPRK